MTIPAARVTKKARLDLRLGSEQKRLLEEAAEVTEQTTSEFVVRAAETAARQVLADRTRFALAPERWAAFSAAVDREPRALPRLAGFLTTPTILDRE
jgi:uncharacterized protein (DUF1778 family)